MFWRLFGTFSVLLLFTLGLFRAVIVGPAGWHSFWIVALVTGLAGLGLTSWLARRITRPLQELKSSAERIACACGDFSRRGR